MTDVLTKEQFDEVARIVSERTSALTKAQREEIDKIVAEKASAAVLSPAQKWDVATIFLAFSVGILSVFGVAGYFVIINAAREAARGAELKAANDIVAERLAKDPVFKRDVGSTLSPVPPGGIVAFATTDTCPNGWSDYATGRGRTLVGAGPHTNLDRLGRSLTNYQVGQTGGEEAYTLSEKNIPSHQHDTQLARSDPKEAIWGQSSTPKAHAMDGGTQNTWPTVLTSPYGEATPIAVPTLPPWVSVVFCQRDK